MLQIENVNISGRGGPIRMLVLSFTLKIDRANTFLIWNECELKFKNTDLVFPFKIVDTPKFFSQEEIIYPSAQVPLPQESIRFIEANRTGDVYFDLNLKYRHTKIDEQRAQTPANITPASLLELFKSTGSYNSKNFQINIPHSNWLRELRTLGWSEIELFEVNRRPFRQDKHLDTAATHLRQAESMFREGEYAATLSSCAQAFESLEKVEVAGTQQKGFDIILYRCFREPEKQAKIRTLLETTRDMCKMGAKEQYPQVPFSRIESEAQLRLTLSLFELLSHQLVENSGPSISG